MTRETARTAAPEPVNLETLEDAFTRIHSRTRVLPAAARRDVDEAVVRVLDGLQALLGVKVR